MYTGRLTGDAVVRNVKGDKTVTGFTLAINKQFKNSKGERQQKTAYIVCSYWRGSGVSALLKKGVLISVTGWPGSEAWIDKDGNAHSNMTLSVDNIQLYGKSTENTTGQARNSARNNDMPGNATPEDDDLPF